MKKQVDTQQEAQLAVRARRHEATRTFLAEVSSPDLGPILAVAAQDGYTLQIYDREPDMDYHRVVITSPTGQRLEVDCWLDDMHKDLNLTREQYYTLPIEQRARLEAEWQVQQGLAKTYAAWLHLENYFQSR
jgi:hypothetical protein